MNISDRHREWLQKMLPHQATASGRFYESALVDVLHEKIRPLTGDREEERQAPSEPPRVGFSGATDSGVRPRRSHGVPLTDRRGPQLEAR